MNLKKEDKNLYERIHRWARNNISKPEVCNRCKQNLNLELSNNSRLYALDVRDWEWICHKCHGAKDRWSAGRILTEEHKRRISESNKKTWLTRSRIPWNKGKTGYKTAPSSETKKIKLRIANAGQIPWNKGKKVGSYPRERMEKLWAGNRGKSPWNKGLKFTPKKIA